MESGKTVELSAAPLFEGNHGSITKLAEAEKAYQVCKVPVSIHVGKPGIGKCLGGAFTGAFLALYKTVELLCLEMISERTEAQDREERLKDESTN